MSQPQRSQVVISVWCKSKRAVHMKRNADGSLKSRLLRHRPVGGRKDWACSTN